MNDFVIDASVAFKWFVWEEGTEQAQEVLDQLTFFYAPGLFLLEIDSVLTKKVRTGHLSIKEASEKKEQFRMLPYKLIDYRQLEEFAFRLATEFPITIYDATYLATAVDYSAKLYTADMRLVRAVNSTPFGDHIEGIGN